MSAGSVLSGFERGAINGSNILSLKVRGQHSKKQKGIFKAASATLCAVLLLIVLLVSVIVSTLSPVHLLKEIQKATNTMLTDAKESMALIFQEFMRSGSIPENIVNTLAEYNILVGYQEGAAFIPSSSGKIEVATLDTGESYDKREPLSLKMGDKIISADDFYYEVNHNPRLYEAFTSATYNEAAYYYDESAQNVFRRIGTSRNNFSGDGDFEEVMNKLMGEGSDIDINNVILVEREGEDGKKYYTYETWGEMANSEEEDFATAVAKKSFGGNTVEANLSAASTLDIADQIAQEQRAAKYYLGIVENISKMQAGYGNEANVNEAMNYLIEDRDSVVVDTATTEVKTISGSMMDAPSMVAVTTDGRLDVDSVKDFSSGRVLETVENQIGVDNSGGVITQTVISATTNTRGTIGHYVDSNITAESSVISAVSPTVNASLKNNSFETIGGVEGGELFIKGAVVVEGLLAKASGASIADDTAVKSYMKLNDQVLALEAEVDRMNRSPLDASSPNTFLGNIVHKLAVGLNKSTALGRVGGLFSTVGKSVAAILPTTHADDENNSYLTNFGDCEVTQNIGAVSSATCAEVAVFDTTTLDGIFNDDGFNRFVEKNTELKNGERVVKKGSYLAKFIINNERVTPNGMMDSGILASLKDGLLRIPFIADFVSSVKSFQEASESDKRIASGAAFVNSSSNPDWENYKYAQRYISLMRAKAAMEQFSGEDVAYRNLKYLEGSNNPVVAFINEYYKIANK